MYVSQNAVTGKAILYLGDNNIFLVSDFINCLEPSYTEVKIGSSILILLERSFPGGKL